MMIKKNKYFWLIYTHIFIFFLVKKIVVGKLSREISLALGGGNVSDFLFVFDES